MIGRNQHARIETKGKYLSGICWIISMPRGKQIRIWIRKKKEKLDDRWLLVTGCGPPTEKKRRGRKKKRVGGYFVFIWKRRLNIARAPHPSGRHSTPPRNKKTGRDFHFQNISFFFLLRPFIYSSLWKWFQHSEQVHWPFLSTHRRSVGLLVSHCVWHTTRNDCRRMDFSRKHGRPL